MSVLQDLDRTGPYRISAARLAALNAEAENLGIPVINIAPENAETTAEWLQVLGKALNFPAHFGANFDALYDCLCDRQFMPQAACLLLLSHTERLEENARDTLIAVLQAVADEWREEQRPFWALFSATKLDLDPLPLK